MPAIPALGKVAEAEGFQVQDQHGIYNKFGAISILYCKTLSQSNYQQARPIVSVQS